MKKYPFLFVSLLALFSLLFLNSNITNSERFTAAVEEIIQEKTGASLLVTNPSFRIAPLPDQFQGQAANILQEQFVRKAWQKTGQEIYEKTRGSLKKGSYEVNLTPLLQEAMQEIGFPKREVAEQSIVLAESEGKVLQNALRLATITEIGASFLFLVLLLALYFIQREDPRLDGKRFLYLFLSFLATSLLFFLLALTTTVINKSPALLVLERDFVSLALAFLFSSLMLFLCSFFQGKLYYLLLPAAAIISFIILPPPVNILAPCFFLLLLFAAQERRENDIAKERNSKHPLDNF
jgi:hypothetical protein